MSDIAASEQRLIAALDRIDRCLDARPAAAGTSPEVVRLVAANEQLMAANRALMTGEPGATEAALRAEIEALTAARAVETGRMGEILTAIEALTADQAAATGEAR